MLNYNSLYSYLLKSNSAQKRNCLVTEERGKGRGVGGPRQGNDRVTKCVCSSCGTVYTHERGIPCTESPCPVCGSVGKGNSSTIEKCKIDTKKKKFVKPKKTKKAEKETASESIYQCMECGKISSSKESCSNCKSINIETLFEEKVKEQEFRTIAAGISDEDVAKKLASENDGLVIQDENDEKKFAVIIKENLDESKQSFNVDCGVEVLGGTLSKFNQKINVSYMIQMDYKSYGLEDFYLSFPTSLTLSGEDKEGESQDIKVDLSNAKIIWNSGKVLAPESITIKLDVNNKVKEIEIEATYIKK